MRTPTLFTVALHSVIPIPLLAVTAAGCAEPELSEQQSTVAERGSQVMPFDLATTTHRWLPARN